MKKRVLASILAGVLTVGVLTGCGSKTEEAADTTATEETTEDAAEDTAADAEETDAAATETKGTITVAASATPHAEILAAAKPILAEQGWDLEVTEFDDYVLPNEVVESGEMDANYFQHVPYLDSFNEEKGTHLVEVGKIHYEPFGIYAGKTASLDELADGAKVAVPNDATNEARALLLLEAQGLLKLKDGAGLKATKTDIVENPKNLDILEVEAAQVPRSLPDVDVAVINGNYAIEAGLKVSDALAVEASDSEAATTYGNVVAVQEGKEEDAKTKALMEALTSDAVKEYIEQTYEGAVVPLF